MKKIIVTVGPSLGNKVSIREVHSENIIYRINGALGDTHTIEENILKIKNQINDAKILLDLPGNKIRVTNLEYGFIEVESGKEFDVYFHQFNFKEFYKYIKVGDIILANDSIFKFEVVCIDKKNKKIKFKSYSSGRLLNNKGFHIKGINNRLPFLFERDFQLIELVNRYKLDFVGLSFVRDEKDIKLAKNLINNSQIIAKVETKKAVENLNNILNEVDYILIDRGDLSTEVGLFKIPVIQEQIIKKTLFFNKKIFLATQILKSMESTPIPTFPEIIDLYNAINKGIYGVQLSEETAIGDYPKKCLNVIKKILGEVK